MDTLTIINSLTAGVFIAISLGIRNLIIKDQNSPNYKYSQGIAIGCAIALFMLAKPSIGKYYNEYTLVDYMKNDPFYGSLYVYEPQIFEEVKNKILISTSGINKDAITKKYKGLYLGNHNAAS